MLKYILYSNIIYPATGDPANNRSQRYLKNILINKKEKKRKRSEYFYLFIIFFI